MPDTLSVAQREAHAAWLHAGLEIYARNPRPEASLVLPTNKRPREYQKDAIEFLSERNALLADECGLGKTLVAIYAAMNKGPNLVICPKRAKLWWHQEITELLPSQLVLVTEEAGRLPEFDLSTAFKPTRMNSFWLITHYEGVRYQWAQLSKFEWGTIICDEAHRLRNRRTQTAARLKMIRAYHKIGLSATPMERNVADLWSILNWLDNKSFNSYWGWFETFVDYRRNYFGGMEARGIKPTMQDEWGKMVSRCTLRRTKAEVAPQLPPKIYQTVNIALTDPQRVLYQKVAKQTIVELETESPGLHELFIPNVLARIVRLKQVVVDPLMLGVDIPSAKYEWVVDWLEDNPDSNVVVFTEFREFAKRLAAQFDGACVIGDAPTLEASKFTQGHTRLLVGTIAAAGEALNLQRASHCIFVDSVYSATKMQQAEDRIHRMDITEPKQIIKLQAPHTVDMLIAKALENKWNAADLAYELIRKWSEYA